MVQSMAANLVPVDYPPAGLMDAAPKIFSGRCIRAQSPMCTPDVNALEKRISEETF